MSVNVSNKKQFLFGIFFLLIIITAVEISLRTYEYISIPCGIFENEAFSNLSYFEIKNICYDTNTLVHGKAPLHPMVPNQYKFTMNINSDGFRGPELRAFPTQRIIFIGDSIVFSKYRFFLNEISEKFPRIFQRFFNFLNF